MFKLESYITPLLLSYVDKYVKNIKPEDSQVSLWGGEAVFSNLDLRLDVLEQELNLPFTFVNGHVHELRIHVPWTKLGSEPVVITINTIECIFRLRSSSAPLQVPRRSRPAEPMLEAGYVQTLVNRIFNNICVVCNNIILKYVEEDIVLSLNVKSAEIFPANASWERAFIDAVPSPADLTLRRLIQVQDLTICLDKRDASGKIETYQDPLLYRCSMVCRVHSLYEAPTSKLPSSTRMHVLCQKLEFSVTDQQLPMLLRLLELGLALYFGDLPYCGTATEMESPDSDQGGTGDEDPAAAMGYAGDQSWSSWAWSMVPQILPTWEGSEMETAAEMREAAARRILTVGVFVDRASCIFKLSEPAHDASGYIGSLPRMSFTPLACLHQYGSAVEFTRQGDRYIHVSVGVSGLAVAGLQDCLCGVKDCPDNFSMEKAFLQCGAAGGSSPSRYFASSLFDPLAPENTGKTREYVLDGEVHLSVVTEEVLVERFPAFALDYMYELELPPDWTDQTSEVNAMFLEASDWRERAVCRAVVGPACLEVNSGLVHRLTTFLHLAQSGYPAYASSARDPSPQPNLPDLDSLIEFVPSRTYHLTLLKPLVRLHPASHPQWDPARPLRKKHRRKQMPQLQPTTPGIVVEWIADCVDFTATRPMYPGRLACLVRQAPEDLATSLVPACYLGCTLKVFTMEVSLTQQGQFRPGSNILLPCSVAFHRRVLLDQLGPHKAPQLEHRAELGFLSIQLSRPKLLALWHLARSWLGPWPAPMPPADSPGKPQLQFQLVDFSLHHSASPNISNIKASLLSTTLMLSHASQCAVLFHGPEDTSQTQQADFLSQTPVGTLNTPWIQMELKLDSKGCPVQLELEIQGTALNLDPALTAWLGPMVPAPTLVLASPDPGTTATSEDSSTATSASAAPQVSDGKALAASLHSLLKSLVLQVKVGQVCLLVPSRPWPVAGYPHIMPAWQEARDRLPPTLAVCLPTLTITSGGPRTEETFPWTLQARKMSVYTVLSPTLTYYLLKPLDFSLTLAVSSRPGNTGPCTHIHMEPLYLCCSPPQVQLCLEVAGQLTQALHRVQGLLAMPPLFMASTPVPAPPTSYPSIWLQWTLPKLTLQLFGHGASKELCLQLETEEITHSLDIQDVYLKAKLKVASLNISVLQRSPGDQLWESGPFNGIILSCNDKITRFISIFSQDQQQPETPQPQAARRLDSRAFLNLTFTQALCSHVHQKIVKGPGDMPPGVPQYLSEFDLEVHPFDFVLWLPVFKAMLDLWRPLTRATSPPPLCPTQKPSWALRTANLPLIYTKASTIRIFVPAQESNQPGPDLCLLQVDSLVVQPHVENPINRIVVRQDLFQVAQGVPGSNIEDRQYQLEVFGVSLSTGRAQDVLRQAPCPFPTVPPTLSENPALAWNSLQGPRDLGVDVVLLPILAKSDFKLIFAPPVISRKLSPQDLTEEVLVCGLTLELNVTLDTAVTLSLEQLLLLHRLMVTCQAALQTPPPSKAEHRPAEPPRDSGIESEPSSLHLWVPMPSPLHPAPDPFVPFEVLLTAKSLSLLLFARGCQLARSPARPRAQRRTHHKLHHSPPAPRESESSPVQPATAPRIRLPAPPATAEEEAGYEGSHDSSSDGEFPPPQDQPDPASRLIPFLYLVLSQPHAFLSCPSPRHPRLELSCFDLQVQGPAPGYYVTEKEDAYLPTPEDFSVMWLETRPGDIPPLTGIPPALFTLVCTDFLNQPGQAQVRLERPLKISWSSCKLEQVHRMYNSIQQYFPGPAESGTSSLDLRSLVAEWVGSIQITAVHSLLLVDVVHDMRHMLSLDSASLDLSFCPKSSRLESKLDITGITFRIAFLSHSYHVVGPFAVSLTTAALLASALPQVWVGLQVNTVPVSVGPRQLFCLHALLDHLPRPNLQSQTTVATAPEEKPRPQTWKDDLRKGLFQYIQDTDNTGLEPKPYQIVFRREADHRSTMMWRYPQPRSITRLEVYPVPLPSPDMQVICQLQYWDCLEKSFKNYTEFLLSENDQQSLTPEPPDPLSPVPACDLWQVVVDSPSAQGISSVSLAACLCVDSCCDLSLVPQLQASLSMDLLQLTFYNHFKSGPSPAVLLPFQPDGLSPQEQEFLVVSLNDVAVRASRRPESHHVEARLSLECLVLEYGTLGLEPLVDGLDVEVRAVQRSGGAIDCQLVGHPCTLALTPAVAHTLSLSAALWHHPSRSELCIPNYYIICNNTHLPLRFGQDLTEESILLPSRAMHAYSWRSSLLPQELRVSAEEGKWSEAFSIDQGTITSLAVGGPDTRVPLVAHIRPLGTLQRQVVLEGRLGLVSNLPWPLEVRLYGTGLAPLQLDLPPAGASPGPTLALSSLPSHLRARAMQCLSAPWSPDVPISSDNNHFLTQIPGDEGALVQSWCDLVVRPVGDFQAITVVLSPLFVVRNHLPRPLVAHLDHCDPTEVPGQGQLCPLELSEGTEWHLSFQLGAESTRLSEPQIALSPALAETVCPELSSLPASWTSAEPFSWPYDLPEQNKECAELTEVLPQYEPRPSPFSCPDQPDTALKVALRQLYPGCRTVVLEVWPWALLVNRSQWSLALRLLDGPEWRLPPGSAFAPPPAMLQDGFSLGVVLGDQPHYSAPVALGDEDWTQGYHWTRDNVVPLAGTVALSVPLGGGQHKAASLTVRSSLHHEEMRLISLWPSVCVSNLTGQVLYVTCFLATKLSTILLGPKTKGLKVKGSQWQPLLLWEDLAEGEEPGQRGIALALAPGGPWSQPLWLGEGRAAVSAPLGSQECMALVLASTTENGVTFLQVSSDQAPLLQIYNNTATPLHYGTALEGGGVEENWLPVIPPGGSQYYSQSKMGPLSQLPPPNIVFAAAIDQPVTWSSSISTTSSSDQFTHVLGLGHVRVYKEQSGPTLCFHVEAISRIEVSAKEIRSAIGGQPNPEAPQPRNVRHYFRAEAPPPKLEVFWSGVLARVSVMVSDCSGPVLGLTLEQVLWSARPGGELTLCLGSIQLDNLTGGRTDFPVILLPQNPAPRLTVPLLPRLNQARSQACMVLEAELRPGFDLRGLQLTVRPLSIFLEDRLLPRLSTLRHNLQPSSLTRRLPPIILLGPSAPTLAQCATLLHPVVIRDFKLNHLNLDLSLRFRLTLFLSVDHSPLALPPFQLQSSLSSPYLLGQLLARHYLAGALLKAGWVVGSLDLLGNPAGLAMALGTGLTDLVTLPYQGLLQGPQAFVAGISSGALSLLRNFTSSSLVSLTNLADSLARNLDYLSMDPGHLERQEECRHQRPPGFSSALIHGLSNLGISLLGAVGGLAEQPLQSAATQGLAGVAGGAARGLVGVVVKPLGGAAGLVAAAGQELLEGAGWRARPQALLVPAAPSPTQPSLLRLQLKALVGQPALLAVDASLQTGPDLYRCVVVALSPQALTVLDQPAETALHSLDLAYCQLDQSGDLLLVAPAPSGEPEDRVAHYIYSQLKTGPPEPPEPPSAQLRFFIHPKLRSLFTAQFRALQRRALGKGFSGLP